MFAKAGAPDQHVFRHSIASRPMPCAMSTELRHILTLGRRRTELDLRTPIATFETPPAQKSGAPSPATRCNSVLAKYLDKFTPFATPGLLREIFGRLQKVSKVKTR